MQKQGFVAALFVCLFSLGILPLTASAEIHISPANYYDFLDQGVPEIPLRKAFEEFETNADRYPRKDFITIIDFRMASTEKRMFLLNMQTRTVTKYLVAHGKNSGHNFADTFSNIVGSNMSSIGAYRTAEIYYGRHGKSMRMDGMDETNDNARRRAIVVHGADYVSQDFINRNGRLGRSLGCPAVERNLSSALIDRINGGTLYYIYFNQ